MNKTKDELLEENKIMASDLAELRDRFDTALDDMVSLRQELRDAEDEIYNLDTTAADLHAMNENLEATIRIMCSHLHAVIAEGEMEL
jgi:predicted nuclease with TOPRIM domain